MKRTALAISVGSLISFGAIVSGLGTATAAGPFDGTYTGTFSGTASGDVEFSVVDNQVTVTKPGSGGGSISGSTITMVVGSATVSGYTCEYRSNGELSVQQSGHAVSNGTWNATCNGGFYGSGNWQATRPDTSGTPTASATSTQTPSGQPRSMSLIARPKTLSEPSRTRLTATLSYCTEDSTIEFQVKKSGEFQTFATVAPQEACTASVRRRVAKRIAFRAHGPADGTYAEVDSRVATVKLGN
jgi:hypothetical protein